MCDHWLQWGAFLSPLPALVLRRAGGPLRQQASIYNSGKGVQTIHRPVTSTHPDKALTSVPRIQLDLQPP